MFKCAVPLLTLMCLAWPVAAASQPAPLPDPSGMAVPTGDADPPPLVLAADAPVTVWVNGLAVALALTTGTVDHVTLNDASVQRIGLSAAPVDNTADLVIGGRVVHSGRHGKGWLAHGGRLLRREFYWFPGQQLLPLAGTIGPFALPHWRIRVEWPVDTTGPAAAALTLPLIGGINQAAYGLWKLDRQWLAVGVDVRRQRPLPLVTAAIGAELAARHDGQLVGEPWQEEVMPGVPRPVRRLQLGRPLQLGPIRIDAVAVRQGGPRDGTVNLAPGQLPPLDAEEDPEVLLVRGRTVRQRQVARYMMLSRTQLEAAGCTSLLVDKAAQRWQLDCAPPDTPPAPMLAQSRAVPVQSPATPLIEPVSPPQPETDLTLGQPLALTLDGRPLRLLPGEAGEAGLLLNATLAVQILKARVRQLPQLMQTAMADPRCDLDAGPLPGQLVRPCAMALLQQEWTTPGALPGLAMELATSGARAMVLATWGGSPAVSNLPYAGRIAVAALPDQRLRLQLGPAPAAGASTAMVLPIADRSHDQGVMGVMALPGIDTLFVGLELDSGVSQPLASMALGQDLIRRHGGNWAGPMRRWRTVDGRLRLARPLALAQPLQLGPLQLTSLLVEHVPDLLALAREANWSRLPAWPDVKGVPGLERELRLPPAVLLAAGCHELQVDKPARQWALACGPLSPPPAPSAPPADPAPLAE